MRGDRALWVALGALVLALVAHQLHQRGPGGLAWWPGCVFRKTTGLLCVGCGMTRATHAALHGDLVAAFRFNPLGVLLLPLALLALSIELAAWVRGRGERWRLRVGARGAVALAVLVIAYWILRNLPWWPFTLLAPPG